MKSTQKAGVRISSQIGGFYEFLPDRFDRNKKYPTFILVHGAGETGAGSVSSLPKVLNNLPARLARDNKFPVEAIVIVPQTTSAVSDASAIALVNYVFDNYPVKGGVICQGLSLGGNFPMKAAILLPERVAFCVPMSAAYDLTTINAEKVAKAGIPSLWFHGTNDGTISVGKTRSNVKKLVLAGANVKAVYFDGVGHDSWSPSSSWKNEDGLTWFDMAVKIVDSMNTEEPPVENPEPVLDVYKIAVSNVITLKDPYRFKGERSGKSIVVQFGPQSVSPASPAVNPATYDGPRYAAFTANKKPGQLILSDLDPSLLYDIVLTPSRAANVRETTTYKSQGQETESMDTYNNTFSGTLKGLRADASGKIVIEVVPGASYAYVSTLTVLERK